MNKIANHTVDVQSYIFLFSRIDKMIKALLLIAFCTGVVYATAINGEY